jgi:thioredoxin reductase (NADPH)
MYDCLIIGGGPAGLTAGIFTARANLKTIILEGTSIGGQIASSPLVENYPGVPNISGAELVDNMYNQVTDLGVEVELTMVNNITKDKIFTVETDDGNYETKSIIIATGAKYRRLGLPNEDNLIGKGIHFCTTCDGSFYKGKDVAVVGGANTAVTNAIYLSRLCNKVYLINRKNELKCEEALIKELNKIDNIEVIPNTVVSKLNGNDSLESIEITTNDNSKELKVDGLFIAVGLDAQSEVGSAILDRDNRNYYVSEDCSTKIPGIFVAGDCREKKIRQLTTATSDGTIAALNVINYLKNLEK